MSSAAATFLGHHVCLGGDGGAILVQLNDQQFAVLCGHAAGGTASPALLLHHGVQQDGMVVALGQREATLTLTVVDGGHRRLQKEGLEGYGQALQATGVAFSWTLLSTAGFPLGSLCLPGPQDRL